MPRNSRFMRNIRTKVVIEPVVEPVVEEPVVEKPVVEQVVEEPVVEQVVEPVVEEPVVEEPVVEELVVEEPVVEELVVEDLVEEPVVEEPVVEEPVEKLVEELVVEDLVEEPVVEPVIERVVEDLVVEEFSIPLEKCSIFIYCDKELASREILKITNTETTLIFYNEPKNNYLRVYQVNKQGHQKSIDIIKGQEYPFSKDTIMTIEPLAYKVLVSFSTLKNKPKQYQIETSNANLFLANGLLLH